MTNGNGGAASVAPPSPCWDYDGTKATEREVADLLAGFVRAMKPMVVVETGTFLGTTTKRLADALVANSYGRLYTIENDPVLAKEYRKMALERVTFIEADSFSWAITRAADVDIAFVDCGEPEQRLSVMEALWPKAKLLALHDTIFYPELGDKAVGLFGPPSLSLSVVNGLMIWQK